jgi:hypothetical protein
VHLTASPALLRSLTDTLHCPQSAAPSMTREQEEEAAPRQGGWAGCRRGGGRSLPANCLGSRLHLPRTVVPANMISVPPLLPALQPWHQPR